MGVTTLTPRPLGSSPDLCPGGTPENSPAIDRWVVRRRLKSPGGAKENVRFHHDILSSLMGLMSLAAHPLINRWAIRFRPAGLAVEIFERHRRYFGCGTPAVERG